MGMVLQDILERKEILLKLNDMNNKEKAKEISAITWSDFEESKKQNLNIGKYICDACLDMAQWKDEQIKQIQEQEIKKCNDYIEKHPNNKLMLKYHLGRLSLCDELLGTDSKDKINMAFATMD